LVELLLTVPLTGTNFTLDGEEDSTHEIGWLTPEEMTDESTNYHPGVDARPLGLICFGSCLTGSGDPYFLDLAQDPSNPPVRQINHDFTLRTRDDLDRASTLAASSLSAFFASCAARTY
jgi:hypothetical protein